MADTWTLEKYLSLSSFLLCAVQQWCFLLLKANKKLKSEKKNVRKVDTFFVQYQYIANDFSL